jgi:hypothetical protein
LEPRVGSSKSSTCQNGEPSKKYRIQYPKERDEIYLYRVVVSGSHFVRKPRTYEMRIIGEAQHFSVDFT